MMTVGSLFSGIGGFDLGLERAGMQVKWQVENEPYCIKVLEKHWPSVTRYGDITTVDWSTVEPVDLVCGGFPCQDLSVAGKRAGIDGARSGLWREYVRCLRAFRPRYVLVENVPGLLANTAMGRVLGDLAACGYDAEWQIISAAAVGARHLRKRVWIVAYPTSHSRHQRPVMGGDGRSHEAEQVGMGGSQENVADSEQPAITTNTNQRTEHQQDDWRTLRTDPDSGRQVMANASFDGQSRYGDARTGRNGFKNSGQDVSDADHATSTRQREHSWQIYPKPESARLNGGSSENWWTVEPNVGRVAHGIPARVDRLKGLGNAVVPQIVEWIGRQILAHREGEQVGTPARENGDSCQADKQ